MDWLEDIWGKLMEKLTLDGRIPRRLATLFLIAVVMSTAWVFYPYKHRAADTGMSRASSRAFVDGVAARLPASPVRLITEPDDGLQTIEQAIAGAHQTIDLVMYELQDPAVEQELASAASRGVAVRVILQNLNSYGRQPNQPAYDFLQQHGVGVRWASSRFFLTHEKMLAADGTQAIIMTLNFQPQYYAGSRDFAVVDTDAADISAIEQTFNADWNSQLIQTDAADDLAWSPGSANVLLATIAYAKNSIDIYSEEMADPRITQALEQAAAQGVAIRVNMTYQTAWKSALQELAAHGVSVRTFSSGAKTYIHAKAIIADGKLAFVGSENFSAPSLDSNRELGIMLSQSDIVSSLEKTFAADWAASRPFGDATAAAGAAAPAAAVDAVIKLSATGICHTPDDPFYAKTTHFTSFPSLQSCLSAGGRLPATK